MKTASARILLLSAAILAAPLAALPAAAKDESGVSVTIRKGPSYLNTRQTPNLGASSRAAYESRAGYQPTYQANNSIGFSRGPLPSTFSVPGY